MAAVQTFLVQFQSSHVAGRRHDRLRYLGWEVNICPPAEVEARRVSENALHRK